MCVLHMMLRTNIRYNTHKFVGENCTCVKSVECERWQASRNRGEKRVRKRPELKECSAREPANKGLANVACEPFLSHFFQPLRSRACICVSLYANV